MYKNHSWDLEEAMICYYPYKQTFTGQRPLARRPSCFYIMKCVPERHIDLACVICYKIMFTVSSQSRIQQYVPQHTISSKPSLPWMTEEIKRTIRKRDILYHKYNRLPTDRCAFLEEKYLEKQKLKQAHNRYIEEILGLANSMRVWMGGLVFTIH